MSAPTTTAESTVVGDPIDVLVPPPRPWWIRLIIATALIVTVGTFGYVWHFGVLRPAPDCCGDASSSTVIGQSTQPDAVTAIAYFHNSSRRAITITGATADLPDSTVVDIAPFKDDGSYDLPPISVVSFPVVVPANASLPLAVTFIPERCDDQTGDAAWGTVDLDLSLTGDPWYPTLGRTYEIPVLEAGSGQLSVLPPAEYDNTIFDLTRPLEAACTLLGR